METPVAFMLVVVAIFMELMLVVSCCDVCAHDRGAFIPYDTNNSSRKTNLTQLSQMTHFLVADADIHGVWGIWYIAMNKNIKKNYAQRSTGPVDLWFPRDVV
jgi:hypothetical protein